MKSIRSSASYWFVNLGQLVNASVPVSSFVKWGSEYFFPHVE